MFGQKAIDINIQKNAKEFISDVNVKDIQALNEERERHLQKVKSKHRENRRNIVTKKSKATVL